MDSLLEVSHFRMNLRRKGRKLTGMDRMNRNLEKEKQIQVEGGMMDSS